MNSFHLKNILRYWNSYYNFSVSAHNNSLNDIFCCSGCFLLCILRYFMQISDLSHVFCSDLLPPLKEVGASCSMTPLGQVSTGYPRRPGGSFIYFFLCAFTLLFQQSLSFFTDVLRCIDIPVMEMMTFVTVPSSHFQIFNLRVYAPAV